MKFFLTLVVGLRMAASPVFADSDYVYSANAGWIDFQPATGGVIVGTSVLSGSGYGANVGWIKFGDGSPENGTSYQNDSATDYGVNHDGAGNLSGYAYAANIGWINFGWAIASDPNRPRVNLVTGDFDGFAYAANIGWIDLRPFSPIEEWRIKHFGLPENGGNGADDADPEGDALKNLLEFAFGTDPNMNDSIPLTTSETAPASFTPGTQVVVVKFSPFSVRGRFIRRIDHLDANLVYTPQFSADLQNWEDGATTPTAVIDSNGDAIASGDYEVVEVPYILFLSNGMKARYFRLTVTLGGSSENSGEITPTP